MVEDVRKYTGAEEVLSVEDAACNGGTGDGAGEVSGLEEPGMVCTAGMEDVRVG